MEALVRGIRRFRNLWRWRRDPPTVEIDEVDEFGVFQHKDVEPGGPWWSPEPIPEKPLSPMPAGATACNSCSKINPSIKEIVMHYNSRNLIESAKRGCLVCRFFQQNIQKDTPWDIDKRDAEIHVDPAKYELHYRKPTSSGGQRTTFQVFSRLDTVPLPSITAREIDPDPLADSSVAIIKSWLSTCLETHSCCAQPAGFSPPTRLIYVGDRVPQLCELGLDAIDTKYAALSHCWGDEPVLLTTATSLAAHKSGILMEDLPLAFQDAVAVTQKLGLDYLWIDSICIVQDSDNDWDHECLRMGDYYRNAYITISALEAADSHQSFLEPRALPKAVQLPRFQNLSIRPKRLDRRQIFSRAALSSRGWSFQERLLSTRVLHFTRFEMFWECRSCSAEETSTAYDRHPAVDFRSLGPSDGEDFNRALSSLSQDNFSESNGAFLFWQRLVRQFSRRSLTFISDRLPAISGLAALIAARTGSQYLAGIWEHDLSGLAWFRDSNTYRIYHSTSRSRTGEYLAPSWSWAAMRMSVAYRFDDGEILRSSKDPILVDSKLQVSGTNPFGNVAGGHIIISALAIPVYVSDSSVRTADGGLKVGDAYMDDDDSRQSNYKALAVRVAERRFRDQILEHFLLVEPDKCDENMWRRIGAGVSYRMPTDYTSSEFSPGSFEDAERTLLQLI